MEIVKESSPEKMTVYWKELNQKYISATAIFIGKLKVAEYFYDGMRPKGDPKQYRVSSSCPGIKENLGNYETVEECEKLCLEVADTMIKRLTFKPE